MPKIPRVVKVGCKIPISMFCKFEKLAMLADMRPQDYLMLMIGEAVGQKEGSTLEKEHQDICNACELMENHKAGIKDTVIQGFRVEKPCHCEQEEQEE